MESIYHITYSNYDLIVVDNGSQDESIEKIRNYANGKILIESSFVKYSSENKPIKIIEHQRDEIASGIVREREIKELPSNKKLTIIRNRENYGFPEGNNIGMEYALKFLDPEYLLILNNDTVVSPGFLQELLKVAEANPEIGTVEPLIYHYEAPEKIQLSGGGKVNFFKGKCFEDFSNSMVIKEVEILAGPCFLIKKNVLEKVGKMDSNLFLYWEEVDWSLRIHSHGFLMLFVPTAKIWHKGGSSTKKMSNLAYYYQIRNRVKIIRRYSNNLQFGIFLLYLLAINIPLYIGNIFIEKRKISLIKVLIKAIYDGLISLDSIERYGN